MQIKDAGGRVCVGSRHVVTTANETVDAVTAKARFSTHQPALLQPVSSRQNRFQAPAALEAVLTRRDGTGRDALGRSQTSKKKSFYSKKVLVVTGHGSVKY